MLSRLWTLLLHVLVLLLHGHSNILDIVFHVNTCYTWHCHFIFLYHCYTDTITLNTIISWLCTTSTWTCCYTGCRYTDTLYTVISYHRYMDSPAYMFWLFLSSYCMHHCSCYNIYRYMNIHVLLWHEYLIQYMTVSCIPNFGIIFLLLDILAVDMRCVKLSPTSFVFHFPLSFLIIST